MPQATKPGVPPPPDSTPDFIPASSAATKAAPASTPDFIPAAAPSASPSAASAASAAPASGKIVGLSAGPKRDSRDWFGRAEDWLDDVGHDLMHGTGGTAVGRTMKAMGAPGLQAGASKKEAEFMGSIPLGLTKLAKGGLEQAEGGKQWQATKDIVGGASDVATLPLLMETGAGGHVAADLRTEFIGSVNRAKQGFEEVAAKMGEKAVPTTDALSKGVIRARELGDTGSTPPKGVRQLLTRLTDPAKGPLTYNEARNFMVNIGRMSVQEWLATNPPMKKAIAEIAHSLSDAIREAAAKEGLGQTYSDAVRNYRVAQRTINGAKVAAMGAAGAAALGRYATYLRAMIP